jgi:hypothetical protein
VQLSAGRVPPSAAGGAVGDAELPPPDEPAEPEEEVPPDATPVPDPPDDEHIPITCGWQVKPSPHSALALHGSCHLKAQTDRVVVVQVVGSGATFVGQSLLGGQGATADPPLQEVLDSEWQTMPLPQSASAVQLLGSHE